MDTPATVHGEVVMPNGKPYGAKRVVAQRGAWQNGFGLANTMAYSCLEFPPTLTECAKKFPRLGKEFAQEKAKLHPSDRQEI